MKRIIYSILISLTVIISFGFRGCDQAYCEFLYNLNSAVGRFSADEDGQVFAVGDEGVHDLDLFQCYASLYGFQEALNKIKGFSFGFADGSSFYCAVGNSGSVVFSSDEGVSWEDHSIGGFSENLFGLDFLFLGGNEPGLVVCGQAGTMSVSTNSGVTWAPVSTITTENLNSVVAIDKSLFIVVGDGGTILKTYDQGSTWEDHTVGGAKFNSIVDGGKVLAYGYLWIAGDGGRIYATTNYGISWFPQNSGVTENLNDIQFRNQNEGVAVGDNGVVRYTTNGGTTWLADSYFNGLTSGDIISLATVDFNTGTAIVRNTTLDGGPSTTMFVVSSEPLFADDTENPVPINYSLEQNYPNPFNPSTIINYSVPQLTLVTIKVYDILGKEIATLVNEEKNIGNYQVDFSGYALPSGVYFYKLIAENFTETKKLVLMK
jgi:photosystem II stability/assembly factor-like uncharacterized protein